MHSIWQALGLFFNIAVFKSRPQDLPASSQVLYLGVGLAFLLGLLRYTMVPSDSYSIFRVVLEVAIPGLVLYLLLTYFKRTNRFQQAFAAICGSGSVIYAVALPVLPSFYAAASAQTSDFSIFFIILLDIWSVAVVAFILRHALEVGVATSISLSIALGLAAFILIESIAPAKQSQSSDTLTSIQSESLFVMSAQAIDRNKIL